MLRDGEGEAGSRGGITFAKRKKKITWSCFCGDQEGEEKGNERAFPSIGEKKEGATSLVRENTTRYGAKLLKGKEKASACLFPERKGKGKVSFFDRSRKRGKEKESDVTVQQRRIRDR